MAASTLAQILFSQGFGTRRDVAGLIERGEVRRGDEVLADAGLELDTAGLVLTINGTDWPVRSPAIVLLHKPVGYECSMKPSAWPSVLTLLPAPLRRRNVQPIGRLDQDTTGALLLTDDGTLLHRLTSPKWHVPKTYQARTARPVTSEQIAALLAGVVLHDDPRPVAAAAARHTGEHALELVLTEGKYHQVKRMVAAVGNHVEQLHRSAFGALELPADLALGRWCWVEAQALGIGPRQA